MRRISFLLLLAAAALGEDSEVRVIRCGVAAAPPRIDGRILEADWREAPAYAVGSRDHIHPNYREPWSGLDDLSATVRALVCGEELYLALDVRDDRTLHAAGRPWWAGDSIEVFLDSDLASREDDSRYSNDDLQLFLMPFHEGLRWGVVARGPDLPYPDGGLRGIRLAHERTPGGYTLEVRIPLWSLAALRPDAEGRIGFDLALNDVDDPDAEHTETYMTLSGRFDLYSTPSNFARIEVGPGLAAAPGMDERTSFVDWTGLLLGLGLVFAVAVAVRRAARPLARRTRVRTITLCALFAGGAAVVSFLPSLVAFLDDSATRQEWRPAVQQAETALLATLDLDTGTPEARTERLLALLRNGYVRIEPRYRYTFLSLSERARAGPAAPDAPGEVRYGIQLEPGEVRAFPLAGRTAPHRLRLDLAAPPPDPRDAEDLPAAEVTVEFEDGTALVNDAPRERDARLLLDTSERRGDALRTLRVRNLLAFQALQVHALYAEEPGSGWRTLPLAARGPSAVPLDVWWDRPVTHIVTVPPGARVRVDAGGQVGHRLWLALGTDGAYPRTPYGETVATVRVLYRDQSPGPELRLVNGRDVSDDVLLYARTNVALEWESNVRLPRHFSLHVLELDPLRPVAAVEVEDHGVLRQLRVAAATLGRRATDAPAPATGLQLRGNELAVRDEVKARWRGLGFAVRRPDGTLSATGPTEGVRADIPFPFGDEGEAALEVRLPRGRWAEAVLRNRSFLFGLAALLLAFAATLAGASFLQRARRLRVKMLVALGAATVVPLLFLVVSLTRIFNDRAESDLKEATLADLRNVTQRVLAAKGRARELASGARDTFELVAADDEQALRQLLQRSREEIEAQDAFLRVPELEPPRASPLGNVSLLDSLTRSGLYYSTWDGLLAVGVARTGRRERCLVGLRAPALPGAPPAPEVSAVLYGPAGDALAAPRGIPGDRRTRTGLAETRARIGRLSRTGEYLYDAATSLRGAPVAAAHTLLRDGGRIVGMLGVYRSRAETEGTKAAVMRTVLLSTFAALMLVVLAGGTLVERVTNRLSRVTRAARSIAGGDLSSRVPVEADDEVGRLASSFNTMADSLGERVHQLTELHRGLNELTAALDREEVARAASELLARATGAPNVVVAAVDVTTDSIEPLWRRGELAPLGVRLPETGPAREAVAEQRTLVREGAVFLPLVASGRPVGLAVASPAAEQLDAAFLDASARQIGIALENARLYRAAVTDELTGLYSRAFFVRRLKEEVDRAAATARPLSLLRIVIEGYPDLARRHGAAVAARLVAESAAVIEQVLPRRNMLARAQPGELLALLVESDASSAQRHLDRLAAALQRHEFTSLHGEPAPLFTYRSVTYPQDGAGADILMDALLLGTESWEDAGADRGPMLRVPPHLGVVLGKSSLMRAAVDVVARVAPTSATVLLTGETGVGKEVLADLIHSNSNRRDQPYVKVNCAAIPETLLEAELFGHEKGAFTGADKRRIGRFEAAHRGTMFLDEVGDLPTAMQIKLLRVLQERRFERVGGTHPIDVDVRIIAATNTDLGAAVRHGEFREDLYHRLHVIELRVPALRERREDIPAFVEHFRLEINRRHGLDVATIDPDALDALYRYRWPGNVRELRNVLERSMLLAGGETLTRAHLALPGPAEEVKEPGPPQLRIEGLTPRQERILAHARSEGGVTNSDIVKHEQVSARTALRELQKLVDRGLLIRVGRRRGAVYRPPEA